MNSLILILISRKLSHPNSKLCLVYIVSTTSVKLTPRAGTRMHLPSYSIGIYFRVLFPKLYCSVFGWSAVTLLS
jgi:hypothetical protein